MKNQPEYTTINSDDIKFFSEIAPGDEAFLFDLRPAYRKEWQSTVMKSPKTGKEYKVTNNGQSRIAVLGIDAVWKHKLNSLADRITKNTGGSIHYFDQIEAIATYLENNCKGMNVKVLKPDDKIAETDSDSKTWLIVDNRKTAVRKAAYIMPFTNVKIGDRYETVGKDGAYFIKGDDKHPAEILNSEEFDRHFVSKDTRYMRRQAIKDVYNWSDWDRERRGYKSPNSATVKVSTHSTFEMSLKLSEYYVEKYPDAFTAHKDGLIINTDEKIRKDKGFMAFIEDMGAMPENIYGRNNRFTLSTNMMYMRGRLSVGEKIMADMRERGRVSEEKIANFSEQMYFDERQGSQGHGGNAPSAHLPWRHEENRELPKEPKYKQLTIFDMIGNSGFGR